MFLDSDSLTSSNFIGVKTRVGRIHSFAQRNDPIACWSRQTDGPTLQYAFMEAARGEDLPCSREWTDDRLSLPSLEEQKFRKVLASSSPAFGLFVSNMWFPIPLSVVFPSNILIVMFTANTTKNSSPLISTHKLPINNSLWFKQYLYLPNTQTPALRVLP
jgi:hypothetical protein